MRVYLPGFLTGGATGDIKLTDAWGVRGAFNHNWDPYWSTSLWGSYCQVRYGGNVGRHPHRQGSVLCELQRRRDAAAIWSYSLQPGLQRCPGGRGHPLDSVKNLTFSAEVGAFFLDQKFTVRYLRPLPAPKPTTVYEFKDQSTVFLNVRAQRNF